jgi:hypothetical protein
MSHQSTQSSPDNGVSPTKPDLSAIYSMIVSDCQMFHCPPGTIPIACLTEDVILIILSQLEFDGSSSSGIWMPAVAAAPVGGGRLVVYGSIFMLDPPFFNLCDTGIVLLNSFIWLTGSKLRIDTITFVGFRPDLQSSISRCLGNHSLRCRFTDFDPESLSGESMILVSSSVNNADFLRFLAKFLDDGGGVGIFSNDFESATKLNPFLISYGVPFACCSLSSEGGSYRAEPISNWYDLNASCVLPRMIANLERFLAQGDDVAVDKLVPAIRYCVRIPEFQDGDAIRRLTDICWTFLKSTGYRTAENLFGPKVAHAIVIVLLEDIWAKMPVERITAHPDASVFPGVSNCPPGICALTIQLQSQSLLSTGLWLNAGVCGWVECDDAPPNLHIQIGAHSRCLVVENGPWHRWPNVCASFPLLSRRTQVVSRFGGLVYLVAPGDVDAKDLAVTFRNFCLCPRGHIRDPDLYVETGEYETPWAEVNSDMAFFVLPKSELEKTPDIVGGCSFLDEVVSELTRRLHYVVTRPYRVVFDVDVSPKLHAEYPLTMAVSDIPHLLTRPTRPTRSLFRFLMKVGMAALRANCFDEETERALVAFAICLTFSEIYGSHDGFEASWLETSCLFNDLHYIHTKVNDVLLPTLIDRAQQDDWVLFTTPEDQWVNFVKKLSDIGRCNFTPLLKLIRAIPLSLATDLERYPSVRMPPPEWSFFDVRGPAAELCNHNCLEKTAD